MNRSQITMIRKYATEGSPHNGFEWFGNGAMKALLTTTQCFNNNRCAYIALNLVKTVSRNGRSAS